MREVFLVFIINKTIMKKLLKLLKKFCGFEKKQRTIKFGWVKDKEDLRDQHFKITAPHDLPEKVDLRSKCPPVYNQGSLGSCTANALGAAYQFEQIKQKKPNFVPSRLFIYYNERVIEGTVNEDAGAMIRDGIKTMVKEGVCPEAMWAYNPSKFKEKPTGNCYATALNNQVLEYMRISTNTLYELKHCLSDGYPVSFGFMIYESFMSKEMAKSGFAKMPRKGEKCYGGHAVLAVGYDDKMEALIVRNSWGNEWGLSGYFYLPYGYILDSKLSADFWTIRVVE